MPPLVCQPPFASESFLFALDQLVTRALAEKTFSGASLLVAKPHSILFHQAWGRTSRRGRLIDSHTLFDLASLTKPLVTAPLCMRAIAEGKFTLNTTLLRCFPKPLMGDEKAAITVRHLLNHSSGLPAYRPFFPALIVKEPASRNSTLNFMIATTPLDSPPGTVSCYSDLGFMLLPIFLENAYEKPLGELATQFLLAPLHLDLSQWSSGRRSRSTARNHHEWSPLATLGFRPLRVPPEPTLSPRKGPAAGRVFAATEVCPWRRRLLIGEVHDEHAYCLGGVAPHAGLFGTAHGVYRLLMFLWDIYSGRVVDPSWPSEIVREFWTRPAGSVPASTWLLGFDSPSPQHSSAGDYFSPHSIGHLGFTGTSFWFDLDRQILVILLTNRVHPTRDNERLKHFRPLLHNLVMETFHGREKL